MVTVEPAAVRVGFNTNDTGFGKSAFIQQSIHTVRKVGLILQIYLLRLYRRQR